MNLKEEFFIELTKKLLFYIDNQDWEGYLSLTDENLSCIESETSNKIVLGLDFHKFFFQKNDLSSKTTFTSLICDPHVKIFADSALITYIRKLAIHDGLADKPRTLEIAETRIWRLQECDSWKMVHFHKSTN